jgi:glycosyltransferase involved in cell wall biosynthesis
MGVPEPPVAVKAGSRLRASLGIAPDVVLFAAFGKVTPEKRVAQTLRALATLGSETPWHLILCGEEVDHYDPLSDARSFGVSDQVTVTGYLDEDELPAYIEAADVCVCMRWPSSRETSASWLRCLAAGKPTIVTDLVHLTDVRSLDPRDWNVAGCPARPDAVGPVVRATCISIDIVDEDHSLGLALRRLSADRDLRETLGRAARQLWTDRFTLDRMASGYERVMEQVSGTQTDPRLAELPPHLRGDGTELASAILSDFGFDNPLRGNRLGSAQE